MKTYTRLWAPGRDGRRPSEAGAPATNRRTFGKALLAGLAGVLASGLVLSTPAFAQSYPDRPIRLIVPFAPGGSTDIAARIVAEKLGEVLGGTVVVETMPGGGTVIGTRTVAEAETDGYTLLYGTNSLGSNPALRDLPYDTVEDLQPIGMVARQPFLLAVHPSVPADTVQEFVDYAKAHPGEVNFGTAGTGTGNHLAQELFSILSETELQHVPYQGDGPMVIDLIAGRIQMTISTVPSLMAQIEAGALKPLGIGDAEPLEQLPNVPPISTSGVPGYVATAWNAMFAPAGTSQEVVDTLSQALEETLDDPEVSAALSEVGAVPSYAPPQEMSEFLKSEIQRWGDVIRTRNIQVQ